MTQQKQPTPASKTQRDREPPSGEVVVVTGAAGCLGHRVVCLLISRDDCVREIRCVDRRPQSAAKRAETERELAAWRGNNDKGRLLDKRLTWELGDVRDINVVERTLDGAQAVIHCAAQVDVWRHPRDQDKRELESVNVGGTETLLAAAVRLGVGKFVHVSSFEAFIGWDTIYYATENTLPDRKWLLFGPSATTKRRAEQLVRQYANTKLNTTTPAASNDPKQPQALNAIIVRFMAIYGEHDCYFVSRLLEVAKFFGGKLRRLDNVWIRQQPIYVGNAAWSLVKANRRMDVDTSISGEEFHITDETPIGDPFEFMEPFLESKGMQTTAKSYPFIVLWLLVSLFFRLRRLLRKLDFLNIFTEPERKSRLQVALELDTLSKQPQKQQQSHPIAADDGKPRLLKSKRKRWHDYVTPTTLVFICNSHFLNRTKASLRLDYEPLFDFDESLSRSVDWYKNHLELE